MWLCATTCAKIKLWFHAYQNLEYLARTFLYAQVVCSLIGSLGNSHIGVLLVNLAVALFAIVAIESGSQTLGRSYAALLGCSILLDITWFILFSSELSKDNESEKQSLFQLVFYMEVGGSVIRFLSSFLWLQMYWLGVASDQGFSYQPIDLETGFCTPGFFSPTASPTRQFSINNEVVDHLEDHSSFLNNVSQQSCH